MTTSVFSFKNHLSNIANAVFTWCIFLVISCYDLYTWVSVTVSDLIICLGPDYMNRGITVSIVTEKRIHLSTHPLSHTMSQLYLCSPCWGRYVGRAWTPQEGESPQWDGNETLIQSHLKSGTSLSLTKWHAWHLNDIFWFLHTDTHIVSITGE